MLEELGTNGSFRHPLFQNLCGFTPGEIVEILHAHSLTPTGDFPVVGLEFLVIAIVRIDDR